MGEIMKTKFEILSEVSDNFQIFVNLQWKYSTIAVNFPETHFSKCKLCYCIVLIGFT